jgi:uncharacterized membrane protein YqhA
MNLYKDKAGFIPTFWDNSCFSILPFLNHILKSMDNIYAWLLKATNVLTSILFFIVGTMVVIYGGYVSVKAIKTILVNLEAEGMIISTVLKGLDLIFLGVVIQILGIGLYELFVHSIEKLPEWLVIRDFDQLKVLLVKASIMVIVVSFVGKVVTWNGEDNILYFGVGIAAIVAALSYFISIKKK